MESSEELNEKKSQYGNFYVGFKETCIYQNIK
jgi:hypothetical protein